MPPKNWIFLRGLAREKRHWGNFPDIFKRHVPNARVECLDFPGIGENVEAVSPTSVAGIMEFTRSEARRRFSGEPFAILAQSLGGMVAMRWMQDYESDLTSVVLINSSSRDSRFYRRLSYQIWPQLVRAASQTQVREREIRVVEMLINGEEARKKASLCWVKIAQEHALRPATFFRQLYAAAKFQGLTKPPSTPVLLLSALGDRFVDPSCSETLHQKFRWQLERHPWGGHDLPWDDPDWVMRKICSFFP